VVGSQPSGPLVGRQDERKALDELLDSVRDGRSGVLVLTGEPGIGKTRLLQYARSRSLDLQIAGAAGMEAEKQLGYAALHRMLLPFRDELHELPGPQRDALSSAFGLASGLSAHLADRFLVGLATLTLLSRIAQNKALLCLVDDAHWLDRESVETLAFIGHRLQADAIGMVFCTRTGTTPALNELPAMEVGGLPELDARRLLAGRLSADAITRAVAETGGNPLALLELGTTFAGKPLPPAPLPLGPRLETLFLHRARALPASTQEFLLLVALAPPSDPLVLWQAAKRLGLPDDASDAAVSAGLLEASHSPMFGHPLMRSAVHGGALPTQRRKVHQALAAVIDPGRDPVRRAWHLGEATVGLAEPIAAELEQAAEHAQGRSTQAMLLSRAAELTAAPGLRTDRSLAAAQAHIMAGDQASALAVLGQLHPAQEDPVRRAAAQRLRARIDMFFLRVSDVPAGLLQAAQSADARDAPVMRLEALHAALLARHRINGTTLPEAAKAVLDNPKGDSSDPLLEALAVRVVHGHAAAVPVMRQAVATMLREDLRETGAPLAIIASVVAEELFDDQARWTLLNRIDNADRAQGALYALRTTLLGLATSELWAGRFAAAEAYHAGMNDIVKVMGLPPPGPVHQVEMLAWQGRETQARAAARLAEAYVDQTGLGVLTNRIKHALTILELSLGRYPQALACATAVFADDPPSYGNLILPQLIEAAVRCAEPAVAADALTRLTQRASATATPWAQGLLARSHALLSDDEDDYRNAVGLLAQTTIVTETARAHLLYGEWLRRHSRRADARIELRTAHQMFTGMGAALFAERARAELLAAGERARSAAGATDPAGELTSSERRVADLAAAGLTNVEIATRLFVTTSTVEYHLSKIFRKLSITSRRQLRS
jgi:DNA-binding CsgD family transcriptional regulator